jgi:hypothetical protein
VAAIYERLVLAPLAAITLVDRFVQLRGTRGAFPAPLGAVRFTLIARIVQGNPLALDPPWLLRAGTNGTGVYQFANEATAGGRPLFLVPRDQYRLRIDADFYQRVEMDLAWPTSVDQMPIVLLPPGYAYPFPDLTLPRNTITLLRGALFSEGGAAVPIEGATVTITAPPNSWPLAAGVTDESGGWVLVVPLGPTAAPFTATLHVVPPAGAPFDVDTNVQPGADNSLPQTALRGLVQSATGVPTRNATVTVDNLPGIATTDTDGRWHFYLSLLQPDAQMQITAVAPGGQSQSQWVQVVSRATVVVPAFSIP